MYIHVYIYICIFKNIYIYSFIVQDAMHLYLYIYQTNTSIYIYICIFLYRDRDRAFGVPQVLKQINDSLVEGETEEGCTRKCEAMMAKLDLHMQRIEISTTDFNLMSFAEM